MQRNKSITKENLLDYSLGQAVENKNFKLQVLETKDMELTSNIKLRKISKIVFDKDENNLEKLTTIFNAINTIDSDIAYIFQNKKSSLNFYIGVMNDNSKVSNEASSTLEKIFTSHFNGCIIDNHLKNDSSELKEIKQTFKDPKAVVTMATAIPSLKDKDVKKENYIQGMEKFLLAMQDKEYTAVLLAKNISKIIETRKDGYEELYTNIFPFVNKDIMIGTNSSETSGTSYTKNFSETLNESTTKTTSTTNTSSTSLQKPSIMQKVQMTGVPTSLMFLAGGVGAVVSGGGAIVAAGAAASVLAGTAVAGVAMKQTTDKNNNLFDSKVESNSNAKNKANAKTKGKATTNGENHGINENTTLGKSLQTSIKFEDKFFKNKLEAIDKQLERINESQNYGMFDFAAYFISDDRAISNSAAHIYNSLIKGEESYLSNSYVIPFDKEDSKNVCHYLLKFQHPQFTIDDELVSVSTMVNSKELAIAMSLPKKSLHGLYIKESVEFGREIRNKTQDGVSIGKIYHLGKDTSHTVKLPLKDFAMHTLVTGATGSGKSTTTYKMIDELREKEIKFLVIEPTKGEYKHIFGNEEDVYVYGTNVQHSPLLKINPFSFPYDEIHILEHIDRLVEIFNACWPMYAAMPAVLKDAILNAYEDKKWDLDDSTCEDIEFPTFEDVLEALEDIMNNSSYSDNTKADYKGALSTRIESLTKGLVSQIFTEDELDDNELFDENVIIDISRVGSSETKSLIMGILLLKLNQYRLANGKMNSDLNHVTILEEAHHLLPRTSKESSSESGNIKGKAVEMLSNSIAEMRTYGEGFIIVDQSPNMLDISAIRNTNTKIIMRLSEMDDRNDIGKSATLSEEQINEIPKLEQGVAIIYQNGWEESVLCKIDMSDIEKNTSSKRFDYHVPKSFKKEVLSNIVKLLSYDKVNILKNEYEELQKYLLSNICKEWSESSSLNKKVYRYLQNGKLTIKENAKYLNKLLDGKSIIRIVNKDKSSIDRLLSKKMSIDNITMQSAIILLLKIANSKKSEEMIEEVELRRLKG